MHNDNQSSSLNTCKFEYRSRGIHIANLNIRHLKPKVDNLKVLLDQNKSIDILGLCETFLTDKIDNAQVYINGFNIERKDRLSTYSHKSGKGGGILIYVAEHIDYSRRKDLEITDVESIWIEVKIKNSKSFLVCSVYRPPTSHIEWCESFSKEIEKALSLNDEIYILGDINFDFKDGQYSNATWKNTVESHDLQQVIQSATRVTANSETIIDHIYVSNTDKIADVSVPCISFSDHYPISFTRSASKHNIKRQEHETIQYRCYKKFNDDDFLNELSTSLNMLSISQTNSDLNFDNFSKIVMTVLDHHAPLKNKRVKRKKQPDWINNDIIEAGRKRDLNHKLKNWNQYKFWRNKTNSLIRNAKKDFFSNSIAENKDNSYLWQHIKDLNGKSSSKLPEELKTEDGTSNDPNTIIEKLNCYFAKISDKLKAERTKQNDDDVTFDWNKVKSYVRSKVPDNVQFNIPLMTYNDLLSSINSLDNHKATGLDGLTPRIIKLSCNVIANPLLQIINICIHTGTFPASLKLGKILPIFKGGDKSDPSNYRPISILSVISKLIEKHVTKHLFGYLNKYDLLNKSQSGLRKHHSCNTALISLLDKWLKSIEEGELVGAIFFDLRKAFDVVDHSILLEKLKVYQFSPHSLSWIKSYLTDRKQCVSDNALKSTFQNVNAGVPQGSVLGPLLFLLFVNDLPLFINETYLELYADDTTVHYASKNKTTLRTKLQQGSNGFLCWCISNDMHVHLQKTSIMWIGTWQNLQNLGSLEIFLEDELIKQVDTQKLLGIIIFPFPCASHLR